MHHAAETMLAMAGAKSPAEGAGVRDENPPVSPERLRVLIVEDDTIIAWALEALLSEIGHEVVDIAPTGERAIASAAEFEPDLVMMDINLGSGMDGIQAAESIRRSQATRLVFVSAYGDPETRERAQQAVPGAPILTKPIDAQALTRTLLHIRSSRH
jgi:CheY-like chemotaxis protein